MTVDASKTKLYADQGVVIYRKVIGNLKLALTGEVKTGATKVPIGANMNLVANVYPAGTLTLANCNLYIGKTTNAFAGGKNLADADEVCRMRCAHITTTTTSVNATATAK